MNSALAHPKLDLPWILDRLPEAIYHFDLTSKSFAYLGVGAECLTGFSVAELQDMDPASFLERIHREDRPRVRQALARTDQMSDPEPARLDARFCRKDGVWIRIEASIRIERNDLSRPPAAVGVIREFSFEAAPQGFGRVGGSFSSSLSSGPDQGDEQSVRQLLATLDLEHRFFQTTAQALTDGVALANASGRLVRLNEAGFELLGCDSPGARRSVHRVPLEELTAETRLRLIQVAQSGKAVTDLEIFSDISDRPKRVSLWTVSPVTDASGRISGVVAIGRDITDLKRAEDRLACYQPALKLTIHDRTAKLAEWAALLELSFDAIVVRDAEDRITYFNRGAEEMYGWSRTQVQGKVTHQLFQTKFPEPLPQIRQKLLQEGRWVGELGHTRRDGSHLTVTTRWALQRDDFGQISGVLETNTDVTSRKKAEEVLHRREQELTAFFEESPLVLFWITEDGHILKANRAAVDLSGYAIEELLGCHISRLSPDTTGTDELLGRLGHGTTVSNHRWTLVHKEGLLQHVLIDANGLWEHGRLVYSRWFVRDITPRLELEREILAISEREQRRLGNDLHDDLCQQLTGIEFLSQTLAKNLAKRSRADASQAREIAGMVRLVMVKTRDLARGLSPLYLEAGGLMTALEELTATSRKLFQRNCLFRCPVPVLVPDENIGVHIYRIAQEAVGNAIKHSGAQHIEIRLIAEKDGFSMEVRDDGIGLSARVGPGSGMGLRIMQYRAQMIGGSLRLTANEPTGTAVICQVRT